MSPRIVAVGILKLENRTWSSLDPLSILSAVNVATYRGITNNFTNNFTNNIQSVIQSDDTEYGAL